MVVTQYTLHRGDCREVMAAMDAENIDAIVSDPPYGLSFMGREWDHGVPGVPFWAEALRVAKPGAHLVAFGGSRTFHRLVCAVEDAGWEIRDVIMWIYGSGFPKSLDVSKAIDKEAGAERADLGVSPNWREKKRTNGQSMNAVPNESRITIPATDAAKQWSGWGTALKPAYEPIILARKPLRGTVARNVQMFGTGAINVDGCRIATGDNLNGGAYSGAVRHRDERTSSDAAPGAAQLSRLNRGVGEFVPPPGRWPANILLDEAAAEVLDQMAPQAGASAPVRGDEASAASAGRVTGERERVAGVFHGDRGGASRFFYTSKASGEDRNSGLYSLRDVLITCSAWENEDRKVLLRVDTAQSPPAVIDVSDAQKSTASDWNTFLFGSSTTAPLLTGSTFTTKTGTSSTTGLKTWSCFLRLITNASTADAKCVTANGGNRAENAASGAAQATITGDWTVSARGVERAASPTQFTISVSESRSWHPTVKPTDLMRWLCRLVTPPGGLILDPFMGSGSTGVAAMAEGFRFVGIDLEPRYVEIAERRLKHATRQPSLFDMQPEQPKPVTVPPTAGDDPLPW